MEAMTEDIDALQRECLKDGADPRLLFIIGNVLDRKKPYMDAAQAERQREVERVFAAMVDRSPRH